MQLPSLGAAVGAARATLRRFPAVIAAGVVSAFAAILSIDEIGPERLQMRLLAAASLGIPLFTAVTLWLEQRRFSPARTWAVGLGATLPLVWLYLAWEGWSEPVQVLRYGQFSVAAHLLVAFLPFVGRQAPRAFWQYNRLLFTRFIVSGASSGALFIGLSLALAALDKLFGVEVPGEGYARLWATLAFVFNTWFFLGGVPGNLDAPQERTDYPAELRVFAQYTLAPLVSMYLVILTLYLGKVLVTWDWPSGWIGWLVSGVATAGILTLLLVHPVAEDAGQKWIAVFARDFWIAVLPAAGMLGLALYQRIAQYALTEKRYLMVVLALWLAGLALYFIVTRSRNIRVIPASLCAVALVTIAGPWSAYSLSRGSQLGRLETLLARHGMIGDDGRIRPAQVPMPLDDRRQVSAVVRYLVETHGTRDLVPFVGDSAARALRLGRATVYSFQSDDAAERIVRAFGVEYVWRNEASRFDRRYSFTADDDVVPVAGFDWMVPIRTATDTAGVPDSGLAATHAPPATTVSIWRDGAHLLDVSLDSMFKGMPGPRTGRFGGTLPAALLTARGDNRQAAATIRVTRVNYRDVNGTIRLQALAGFALVRLPR